MICHACHEPFCGAVAFCPQCGQTLAVEDFGLHPAPRRRRRTVRPALEFGRSPSTRSAALLLALVPLFCFGIGGLHQFYTGRVVYGVLQFLTLGGLCVWALCDVVRIASGDFRDAENRRLADV